MVEFERKLKQNVICCLCRQHFTLSRAPQPESSMQRQKQGASSWMRASVGLGLCLFFGGKALLEWAHSARQQNEQMMKEQDRQLDLHAAQMLEGRQRCADAVRAQTAPARVLNMTYLGSTYSLAVNVPRLDYEVLKKTSSGYSTPFEADLGGRIISFECYLDEDRRVVNLAYLGG